MAFDWTPVEEGESLNASNLDTKFSEVTSEINDLEQFSIAPRSLHQPHLPSLVPSSGSATVGAVTHTYSNVYPGWDDDTYTSSSASSATGWTVVTDGTSSLHIVLTGDPADLSDDQVAGVLVLANVQITNFVRTSGNADNSFAVFKIQAYVPATSTTPGGWVSKRESERYYDADTQEITFPFGPPPTPNVPAQKDVSIRTFFMYDDIRTKGVQITLVRLIISIVDADSTSGYPVVTLQHGNISAVAFYGGRTEL